MATFDEYLDQVRACVGDLRDSGRPFRETLHSGSPEELTAGLPVEVGPQANAGIILRSDTFVELGSPDAGSCGLVLWTDDPTRIHDGRVTLIGPDIPDSSGKSLPFGQVLLVGGRELDADAHQEVGQAQYISDQIEGYMIKSSSRNLWARVGKDVAGRGFSFDVLGRALMSIFKSTLPKVESVEVVFVTSGKEDVARLGEIAGKAEEIGSELVKEHWKSRGYDLDCDLHCGSCSEKEVCDDIRKVVAAKTRKEREAASAATNER